MGFRLFFGNRGPTTPQASYTLVCETGYYTYTGYQITSQLPEIFSGDSAITLTFNANSLATIIKQDTSTITVTFEATTLLLI